MADETPLELEASEETPRFSKVSLVYGALLGAVGGIVGCWVGEPLVQYRSTSAAGRLAIVLACSGLYAAFIGTAVGMADGLKERSRRKTLTGALLGALLGLGGGVGGGWLAELVYETLVRCDLGLIGRSLGWLLVGGAIGVSVGAASRSPRRACFSAIGGMVGGYLGGGSFEVVDVVVANERLGRLIALGLTGGFIGAVITLVEEIVKQAWVIVLNGRLEGVRFILTKTQTLIGRSVRSDIGLSDYEGIARDHARIVREGNLYLLMASEDSPGVQLNGRSVKRGPLTDGDRITVGKARLAFGSKGTQDRPIQGSAPSVRKAPARPDTRTPVVHPFLEAPSGRYALLRPIIRIGRDPSNDIVLLDPAVRPFHAEVRESHGRFILFDVGREGGVTVNGRPTVENMIKDGFRIGIGPVFLVFRSGKELTPIKRPRG